MKILPNNIIFGIRIGAQFTAGSKIVCTLIKIDRRNKILSYKYFNEYLEYNRITEITFQQFEDWLNSKWYQII